ncbi:MAG TPA: hypothetical protein VIF62_18780 [Labilithrix sp.]
MQPPPSKNAIVVDALRSIAEELDEYLDERVAALGLDAKLVRVIRALRKSHDDGFNPPLNDFAKVVGSAKSWTSVQVKRLEALGLVERKTNRRDKRLRNVLLSPKGEEVAAALEHLYDDAVRDVFEYTAAEMDQLYELLIAYFM